MWHILQLRVRVVPVDMGELGMGWLWLLGITKPDTSIPKNSSELYNTIICIVQGIVAVGLLSLDREDDWLCHNTTQIQCRPWSHQPLGAISAVSSLLVFFIVWSRFLSRSRDDSAYQWHLPRLRRPVEDWAIDSLRLGCPSAARV